MSANFNIVDLLKRKQPRQPFDERLPDGGTVDQLLRRGMGDPNSLESRTGELEGIAPPRQTPSPAIQRAALGVPNSDIVSLLKQQSQQPPLPSELNDIAIGENYGGKGPSLYRVKRNGDSVSINPLDASRVPPPNEGPASTAIPPVRVGESVGGKTPLERQQALVDLMRSTPAGQKVRQQGDFIEVTPPEKSPSRVKNALVGLLLGTAQGGLPGGIAGLGLGAVKPEAVQQMLKDKHVAREEGQLNSRLDTEAKRADIDYRRAQADRARQRQPPHTDERVVRAGEFPDLPEGTIINRVWNPESGKWEDEVLNGQPVIAKSSPPPRTTAPHYIERDDGVYRVDANNPEGVKLKGVPPKTDGGLTPYQKYETETKEREREAKRQAAQAELDQLVHDEALAGANKNRAYKYLEEVKKNVPDDEMGRADIAEARRAAEEADKIYNSFAEKKRDAQTRIRENTVASSPSAQPYAGRTMSAANLAKYAKDKGISEDEARKQVEAQGVRVQ